MWKTQEIKMLISIQSKKKTLKIHGYTTTKVSKDII